MDLLDIASNTAPTMEPFTYNPLNNPKEEFRLLRLHPRSPEDKLRCDLEHVDIKSSPGYLALSCTWGDPF
jgi:hypothetical protein